MKKYLHFVDNTTLILPNTDKLAKIRPIIEIVNETCMNNYSPNKERSVDEAMIKFKGRSAIKQYMPKKPIERGNKVWVRADGWNGNVSDFRVYCGETSGIEGKNLGGRVVTSLTETLKNKYYHVYFDNYFSSVQQL